jgi:hypothetical protein
VDVIVVGCPFLLLIVCACTVAVGLASSLRIPQRAFRAGVCAVPVSSPLDASIVLLPTLDPKTARAPLAPLAPFQRQKAVLLVPSVLLDRACGVSCAMLVA